MMTVGTLSKSCSRMRGADVERRGGQREPRHAAAALVRFDPVDRALSAPACATFPARRRAPSADRARR